MARFYYTAERGDGEVYRGVADVSNRYELYQVIRREGGRVISVEQETKKKIWSIAYWNSLIATVPEQEKIIFARNLSAMLSAGLSLARALSVVERQTKNPKFSQAIAQIGSNVRHGSAFHDALKSFPYIFSPLFVAMVRAGEESGDLPASLATISEQMDRAYALKKKVRSALIYPSIIIIAIIGIGGLMLTQVVPTLAQTFEELNAELPKSTQAVISISDFLVENTLLAMLLIVFAIGLFIVGMRSNGGRRVFEFVILHLPLVRGIVCEVNAARTARTVGSLLTAGVDMVTALSITKEVVQNTYFKRVLTEAIDSIEKGRPLSHAFSLNEKLYPPLVGEMIAVGEETGELSSMLTRLAEFYEEEVSRKTKDMSTIIEPFLMLIIGAAVGFFAISMISPIYSLSESI
jgi:type IV pilus assembly protein PilC